MTTMLIPLKKLFGNFIIIILAILIEAFPFIVFGALIAGIIEEFVPSSKIIKVVPKKVLPATIIGSMIGFVVPMCECGSVVIVRRLLMKGMPVSSAITYMISGPIVNPITLISTSVAYSWYPKMTLYRALIGMSIAIVTGLIIDRFKGNNVLKRQESAELQLIKIEKRDFSVRLRHALNHAMDDFIMIFSMLLIGATVTAIFKAFSPADFFLFFKTESWIGVPSAAFLAFLLSLCSEADAFIASALNGILDIPSQIAFLTLGPMLDLKLIIMYKRVFSKKVFFLFCSIPALLVISIGLLLQKGGL